MNIKLFHLLLGMLIILSMQAQESGEFTVFENGLIYSEETMVRLKGIVEDLNTSFQTCDLDQTYWSTLQGKAIFFKIEKATIKPKDWQHLQTGKSWNKLQKVFPQMELDPPGLGSTLKYTRKGEDFISLKTLPFNFGDGKTLKVKVKDYESYNWNRPNWVFEINDDRVEGFYFPEGLTQHVIPEVYARMIQYVDCLIDTDAQVKLPAYFLREKETSGAAKDFEEWINRYQDRPVYPVYPEDPTGKEYEVWSEQIDQYYTALEDWESLRDQWIRDTLSKSPDFDLRMQAAITIIRNGGSISSEVLEQIVTTYGNPADLLDLKRSRRVIGFCSMDLSPRIHAQEIAVLSATTANWEVFLRAHLDIMNDRFDRSTDGSYAWAGRKTYLRELESLSIEVPELLLGSIMKSDNLREGHYRSTLHRVGRALAESQELDQVESSLFTMIADPKLDLYNRLLMLYVYRNMLHYLEDSERLSRLEGLQKVVQSLPEYVSAQIILSRE